MPLISNVPVAFQRAEKAHFSLPLSVGDTGLIIFSERSIDLWLERGVCVDPEDPRKFHLSDAIFFPGVSPKTKALERQGKDDSVEIRNDKAFIELQTSGKFKISNGTNELIDLLVQVVDTLSTTTTNTIFGPLQLNDFSTFASLKTKLETLKGE